MPNQSLVDLTERTATADTDLVHVNSGGSDYKQTKANFLRGNLSLEFSFSSLLTAQVDALPVDATYFGYLWNYGHTTETGMPINGLSYINVKRSPNAQYAVIEAWSTYSPEADHYICGKSSGTWGSWTKVPTRSEITSLNNSLTNWNYYQVGSNSYGALDCRYNPSLKLCFMTWRGNSTAPGSTQYSFNLPSSPVLTPNDNAVVKLRNGDSMEVRTDNTVKVNLTGTSWSGGSLMYPTR